MLEIPAPVRIARSAALLGANVAMMAPSTPVSPVAPGRRVASSQAPPDARPAAVKSGSAGLRARRAWNAMTQRLETAEFPAPP